MAQVIEEVETEVSPEMAAVWNDDREIDFYQLRNELGEPTTEQESESETEGNTADNESENVDTAENAENDEGGSTTGEPTEEPEHSESETDDEGADDSQPEPTAQTNTEQEVKTHKFKADGMEFEFTEKEIVEKFGDVFAKAMNYTRKTTALKPWTQTISALQENKITQTDVNLMIDVLKGDKSAIAEVLKRTGVDALEIDTDSKETYVPNQYGKDEYALRIEEILDEISVDQEYKITEHVIDKQWDDASRKAFANDPDMILGLHNDIKNGVYDKVAPLAMKMKVLDNGRRSDLEYYMAAGEQYFANQSGQVNATVQAQAQPKLVPEKGNEVRQQTIKAEANKRKAASVSKPVSGNKDVVDYLSEDDGDWEAWYKELQAKH